MARPKGAKTKKPDAKKTGPRFTLTDRERLKDKVARLDLQGLNLTEIAREVDTSRQTVATCLKEIQQDYQDAYIDNRKMWAMREYALLMDVRRRAYEEIAALKEKGKRKTVNKSGSKGDMSYDENQETVEDPDLLGWNQLLLDTAKEVVALMGLRDLPAQVLVQINNAAPNFFREVERNLLAALDAADAAKGGAAGAVGALPAAEVVNEKETG